MFNDRIYILLADLLLLVKVRSEIKGTRNSCGGDYEDI